jgi:proline iminopeptidase
MADNFGKAGGRNARHGGEARMHVTVNGVRLFFDVAGEKLVADGPNMRKRPTVLLLHGGPGFDHSMFKPSFAPLAEVAQLIYLDHRGNGRSEHGYRSRWTLDQWGDDVRDFCDAVGIEQPIVLGYSFGGIVAQSYAVRHPDHPAKLVLYSTAPVLLDAPVLEAFRQFGGPEVHAIASAYLAHRTPETTAAYRATCFPLYNTKPNDPNLDFAGSSTTTFRSISSRVRASEWTSVRV